MNADIEAKAATIASLEETVREREATIESLQADIEAKTQTIASKDAELEAKMQTISALEADVAAGKETILERENTIAQKESTIAARESDIAALQQDIQNNQAAHQAALESQKAEAQQQRDAAVAAARKEEYDAFKQKLAQIQSTAKSTLAASTAAAESAAKAKALSYKNVKALDNGLSVDAFRSLVRAACAIEKGAPSGKAAVMVDDFTADTAALASKYEIPVLHLAPAGDKFEKSATPADALQVMTPAFEAGDDVYFFTSSEKKTGAMACVSMAAREAESDVAVFDTEALTGSALAYALGFKYFSEAGESKQDLLEKKLTAVTYLNQNALGMIVKGKFKKTAKTDDINLPLALDYLFGDCDKRFAFVLYHGYSEEQIKEFTDSLKAENEFDEVIAEPTADMRIKAVGAKSATVYYFM